jgi:hypothetical protein
LLILKQKHLSHFTQKWRSIAVAEEDLEVVEVDPEVAQGEDLEETVEVEEVLEVVEVCYAVNLLFAPHI